MSEMTQTKFEEDLKAYFPDIYKIHTAGKFDRYVWEAFTAMMEMVDKSEYGEVVIHYQCGRIDRISKTTNVTSGKETEAYKTHPNFMP